MRPAFVRYTKDRSYKYKNTKQPKLGSETCTAQRARSGVRDSTRWTARVRTLISILIIFLCLRPIGCRRHYVFGLSVRPSVRPYGNLVNTKSQEPLGGFLSYLAQGCTMTSRWTNLILGEIRPRSKVNELDLNMLLLPCPPAGKVQNTSHHVQMRFCSWLSLWAHLVIHTST